MFVRVSAGDTTRFIHPKIECFFFVDFSKFNVLLVFLDSFSPCGGPSWKRLIWVAHMATVSEVYVL